MRELSLQELQYRTNLKVAESAASMSKRRLIKLKVANVKKAPLLMKRKAREELTGVRCRL
jgi:hypothetical protein